MNWFVNYEQQAFLPIDSRSISYGDGVFETILISHGCIQRESLHFERLLRGLHKLKFSVAREEIEALFSFVRTKIDNTKAYQGVKILITRGGGGRGYWPSKILETTFLVGFFDLAASNAQTQNGVVIDCSATPSTINRQLAGVKHLNRLENVLAKQALDSDCFEAVMQDDDGFLTECIQSNLFWFNRGVLYTPILTRSGVQGTLRNSVVKHASNLGIETHIGHYQLVDLCEADEVFICNSLTGVIPVIELKNNTTYKVGSYTQQLQQMI